MQINIKRLYNDNTDDYAKKLYNIKDLFPNFKFESEKHYLFYLPQHADFIVFGQIQTSMKSIKPYLETISGADIISGSVCLSFNDLGTTNMQVYQFPSYSEAAKFHNGWVGMHFPTVVNYSADESNYYNIVVNKAKQVTYIDYPEIKIDFDAIKEYGLTVSTSKEVIKVENEKVLYQKMDVFIPKTVNLPYWQAKFSNFLELYCPAVDNVMVTIPSDSIYSVGYKHQEWAPGSYHEDLIGFVTVKMSKNARVFKFTDEQFSDISFDIFGDWPKVEKQGPMVISLRDKAARLTTCMEINFNFEPRVNWK